MMRGTEENLDYDDRDGGKFRLCMRGTEEKLGHDERDGGEIRS